MGRELIFDRFSQQALQTLHRYRAVMFSPTCRITIKKNVIRFVCKKNRQAQSRSYTTREYQSSGLASSFSAGNGKETVNSLYFPSILSTLTYPPCSRATFIT